MVSPYWKQIAMTNVKKFVSSKLYGNYLLVGKYIKNKHNLQNVKTLLRLRKLGTSTQINQLATDVEKEYFLKSKIDGIVTWYEQFTGMDEVRLMQNRVIEAQNRLVQAQEKRRESTKALSAIQNKIKDIRAELDTTSKGEERYLQLITQEHAVLKEERNLNIQFQMSEKEERDCFSFLSSAVKESHEKERAQADRTKYWSVIGSIIGTVIGVVGSSINNEFKMRELRRLVRVSVDDNSDRVSLIKQHQQELLSLIKEVKSSPSKSVFKDEEILLHSVSNYQHETNLEKLLAQQTYEVRVLATIAVTVSIICLLIQKL